MKDNYISVQGVGRLIEQHLDESGYVVNNVELAALGLLHAREINTAVGEKVERIVGEFERLRPVLPFVAATPNMVTSFKAETLVRELAFQNVGIIHNSHFKRTDGVWLYNRPTPIDAPEIWPFAVDPTILTKRGERFRRTRKQVVRFSVAVGIFKAEHLPRLHELVTRSEVRLQLLVQKGGRYYGLFRMQATSFLEWARACRQMEKQMAVLAAGKPHFSLDTMLPVDVDKPNGARVYYWK